MRVSEAVVAFAIAPSVVLQVSPFSGGSCHVGEVYPVWRPGRLRRFNRAQIVSLGSASSPPPSPEGSEEGEGMDENTSIPQDENVASEKTDAENPVSKEEVTAEDILNSPTFLKKKLELVQKELVDAKSKLEIADEAVDEEKQNYVRLAADFENYRRRSLEDLRQQDARSTAKVCKELLSVLDNFERATVAVNAVSEKEKSIVKSYEAINRQLLDALTKLNVEPIDAVGDPFDPEVHEAIQRLESNDYHEDVVCQQYSRGYKIGKTLIRAAIVGVSIGPGPEDSSEENGTDTADASGSTATAAPAVEGL